MKDKNGLNVQHGQIFPVQFLSEPNIVVESFL